MHNAALLWLNQRWTWGRSGGSSTREKRRVRTAPLVVKTDMAVRPEHGVRWRSRAKFHRETLHGYERRLAKIGGELKRVKECVGLPQHVAKEAESLVKRYFDVVGAFRLRW